MEQPVNTATAVSEKLRKGEMTTDELIRILSIVPGCKVQVSRNMLLVHTKEGMKSISQLLSKS